VIKDRLSIKKFASYLPLSIVEIIAPLGIFIFSIGLYSTTIAPSLSWGFNNYGIDSGELLSAAKTLGIPHPPGYPTYTLLLHLYSNIVQIGDLAFRGNTFSTLNASITVLIIYFIIKKSCTLLEITKTRIETIICATIGSVIITTAPLFWANSLITEVYTLNTVFVSLLILLSLKITEENTKHKKLFLIFGLLSGIGIGNHLTLIFISAPLILWITHSHQYNKKRFSLLILGFLIGCAIYLYLPIRALSDPPINWGNPVDLKSFLWVITAEPYKNLVLGVNQSLLIARLSSWSTIILNQFTFLGLFIGLMAPPLLYKKQRWFLICSTTSMIFFLIYSITYNSMDAEVLLLPIIVIFSIWIGIGFAVITAQIKKIIQSWTNFSYIYTHIFTITAIFVLILISGLSITNNYKSLNLSDNQNALEYAQAVFDKIPNQPIPSLLKGRIYYPNQAIIIADNEQHVFSLWYLLYGTKSNKKVMVISSRLLQFDWYIEQIRNQYPFQIPRNSTTNFTAHERLKNIINHNQDNVDIFFTYQTVLFPQTQEGLIYRLETAR